jgi:hypothetical protein
MKYIAFPSVPFWLCYVCFIFFLTFVHLFPVSRMHVVGSCKSACLDVTDLREIFHYLSMNKWFNSSGCFTIALFYLFTFSLGENIQMNIVSICLRKCG